MKQRTTHHRYFATFEALPASGEEGLAHFQAYPGRVKQAMGTMLETFGGPYSGCLVQFFS